MTAHRDPRRILEDTEAALAVGGNLARGEPELETMAMPVKGDVVAGGEDAGGERGPPGHLFANEEERRLGTVALELLEHRRGPLRVWTVVECERHAGHPGQPSRNRDARGGGEIDGGESVMQHSLIMPNLRPRPGPR
jgi:hypothetical protein